MAVLHSGDSISRLGDIYKIIYLVLIWITQSDLLYFIPVSVMMGFFSFSVKFIKTFCLK